VKYHYFYQSRENKSCDDWIDARDRGDAYAQLRRRGIKPYKLLGRDPLPWKRWTAIAVLGAALAGTYAWLALRPAPRADGLADGFVRHQIYGDPAIIESGSANGWAACGFDGGERVLSLYAQPGKEVRPPKDKAAAAASVDGCLGRRLEPQDGELTEYRQMKLMVESMKAELRRYKAAGGTTPLYLDRLQARQSQEVAYYRAAAQEVAEARLRLSDEALSALWAAKNAELRAIGLPMLKDPAE